MQSCECCQGPEAKWFPEGTWYKYWPIMLADGEIYPGHSTTGLEWRQFRADHEFCTDCAEVGEFKSG
jgi:hypothetical protein